MRKIALLTTISLAFFACQTSPTFSSDDTTAMGDTSLAIIFLAYVEPRDSSRLPSDIRYDTSYHRWYYVLPDSVKSFYPYEQDLWAIVTRKTYLHEIYFSDSIPKSAIYDTNQTYFPVKVLHMNEDCDMY